MAIDRVDWHWDDAEAYYRINHGVGSGKELTEEQIRSVFMLAGNHIGMFLRWLIDRDFQSEDAIPEKVALLRSGKVSGAEFLMTECDGKFWEEDVREDILPFVQEYYDGGKYYSDYGDCCLSDDKPLYGTISGDEEYARLKERIDAAYEDFVKRSAE